MKRKSVDIRYFFSKKARTSDVDANSKAIDPSDDSKINTCIGKNSNELSSLPSSSLICDTTDTTSSDRGLRLPTPDKLSSSMDLYPNDIGRFLKKNMSVPLTAEKRYELLTQPWTPDISYNFPAAIEHGHTRKFQHSWLQTWNFLVYSPFKEGAFCKFCALFGPENVRNQYLGKLVSEPLGRYKDAREKLNKHAQQAYHSISIKCAEDFLKQYKEKGKSIINQLDSGRQRQIEENRSRIRSVIKTVIFCGQQEVALRGHRDHGPLHLNRTSTENDGIFRAALRFRVDAGDEVLANHLETAGSNATYLSWQTQNEIITACGDLIVKALVSQVKDATFYSLLLDDTTDAATREQCSISVRFIKENKVHERFLGFIDVSADMTAKGIASAALSKLIEVGLDPAHIRGQGYDGASTMSGQWNGVQAQIKKVAPAAPYVHCMSHVLNLSTQAACPIPLIRNTLGQVKEIAAFFNMSAKRTHILEKYSPSKKSLQKVCPTRWVEGHSALLRFTDMIESVVRALEELSQLGGDTGSAASTLTRSICSTEFLISIFVMTDIAALLLPISKALQSPEIDLLKCMEMVDEVIEVLNDKRKNAEDEFNSIMKKHVEPQARGLDVELALPRRTGRQIYRSNHTATTPEEFYRISLYIPYLENLINQLETRFQPLERQCLKLQCVIPAFMSSGTFDTLSESVRVYKNDIGSLGVLKGEYERWRKKWSTKKKEELPTNVLQTLNECDELFYPNIHILLRLFATLPVTSGTNERSFSTLRRLVTYMRSSMGQERLNGLAHLSVNRDVPLSVEAVIDELANKKRRLNFALS